MNDAYLFILGRTPELSVTELFSMFPTQEKKMLSRFVIEVTGEFLSSPKEIIHLLGGVIKIAIKKTIVPEVSPYEVARILSSSGEKVSRLSFGISTLENFSISKKFLDDTKKELKSLGISSRFVEGKDGMVSSIVFEGQDLVELIIFPVEEGFCIAQTLAVQDAQEWNDRDYGRPFADAKRGMLPLKVSRMIVNIALGPEAKGKLLVDPFCGMGTIIGEAYVREATVIGMDIDAEAVEKSEKNMKWLQSRYNYEDVPFPSLLTGDAVHLSDHVTHSIDAIVTEPYMGKTSFALQTNPDIEKMKNTLKGLEKLYIGCLKDWHKVLNSEGIVILAIPSYIINNHEYTVKTIIDSCEKFGYSIEVGPLTYSRPQATVKRNFFIFKKR